MLQPQNQHKNLNAALFLATAAAFAVNLVFTILRIVNLSNLTYYYSFKAQQVNIVVFSPLTDQLIWLATLTAASSMVLLTSLRKKINVKTAFLTILPTLGLLLVFQTNLHLTDYVGIPLSILATCTFIRYSQNFFVNKRFATMPVLIFIACIVLSLEVASLQLGF